MGLYGLLAAGASQQTYVSSESWETIFGTVFSSATLVHLIVEAALEERGDELHLMRMIPLAFLTNTYLRRRLPSNEFLKHCSSMLIRFAPVEGVPRVEPSRVSAFEGALPEDGAMIRAHPAPRTTARHQPADRKSDPG